MKKKKRAKKEKRERERKRKKEKARMRKEAKEAKRKMHIESLPPLVPTAGENNLSGPDTGMSEIPTPDSRPTDLEAKEDDDNYNYDESKSNLSRELRSAVSTIVVKTLSRHKDKMDSVRFKKLARKVPFRITF
jgi:hypothetical protein